tara:strand:+ start:776 stop:1291 length:516 start_codon:yes stop_codon:yes gene_type:complete
MKIAICGKMCSGKSTIANMLKEYDDRFEIFSFANKIKVLANELFNMDLKNKDRSLMIAIGSKMREIDPDVWVNYIIKETKDKEFCIIDDLRFQNELDILEKNDWKIISLNISQELQIERIKNLYKDNYEDHFKNRNHLSEKDFLIFKDNPLIIDSSLDLNSIKKQIIKIIH